MATAAPKNRFAGLQQDDSDDEPAVKTTKTQKKKEERKITEKPVKINHNKMAEGGFEVTNEQREPKPFRGGRGGGDRGGNRGGDGEYRGRGGRGGGRGGDRGGRGGDNRGPRGGGRGGGGDFRPKTAEPRLDADGNPIAAFKNQRGHAEYRGKPRQADSHPFDRKDGTGRGGKQERRQGGGKANWGEKDDKVYQKKDEALVTAEADASIKPKEEKKEEPKEEYIEEVLGQSLEDFMKTRNETSKKEARAAEGIKGEKTQTNDRVKESKTTVLQNQYMKTTHARTADSNNKMMGFGAAPEEEAPPRDDRPNTRGRGGRKTGGTRDSIVNTGAKRQNARQALKKTDEDFPTL